MKVRQEIKKHLQLFLIDNFPMSDQVSGCLNRTLVLISGLSARG